MSDEQLRPGEDPVTWAYRTGRLSENVYNIMKGPGASRRVAASAPPAGTPAKTPDVAVAARAVLAMGGSSAGLLPAFTTSGLDPEELRKVPSQAWQAIALEPDLEQAQALVEELSTVSRSVMASAAQDRAATLTDDEMVGALFGEYGPEVRAAEFAREAKRYRQGGIL